MTLFSDISGCSSCMRTSFRLGPVRESARRCVAFCEHASVLCKFERTNPDNLKIMDSLHAVEFHDKYCPIRLLRHS